MSYLGIEPGTPRLIGPEGVGSNQEEKISRPVQDTFEKYLDTDTFSEKYLDTDTFKILSEKSI